MDNMQKTYDAVIVGGGIVGATAALALGQQQYNILLIEQKNTLIEEDIFQARTIALSYASFRIFSALGVWEFLHQKAVAINKIMISMKNSYGTCRLTPPQHYDALGYVVGQKTLEKTLYDLLAAQRTVEILTGCHLIEKHPLKESWQLTLSNQRSVNTTLLIAADGANSQLRDSLTIGCEDRQYHHYALLTNLEMEDHLPFTAVERFLPNGAIALLPWQKNYMTCVWTTTQQAAHLLKENAQSDFLMLCQKELGLSVGKIKACAARLILPLSMKLATQQLSARFLLLGNAAHSLHPIAAQGFNLSLRDIWQLRTQLIKRREKCDLGERSFLTEYVSSRQKDQKNIIFVTDKIARFMSSNVLPSPLRAMGLTLLDSVGPLKRKLTQLCMGLS